MATSYPHQLIHESGSSVLGLRPICAYCLHLLGTVPVTAVLRRELEEHHTCAEKVKARQPAAPMPYN